MVQVRKLIFLAVILLVSVSVTARMGQNEASDLIEKGRDNISVMKDEEVPTNSTEDIMAQAEKEYEAQVALNKSGGTPDFSRIEVLVGRIHETQKEGLETKDRIIALELRLESFKNSSIDFSKANSSLETAWKQFRNLEFEKARNTVETAYSQISEAQSTQARLQGISDAARDNTVNFVRDKFKSFREKWKRNSLILVMVSIVFFFGFRTVSYIFLRRKNQVLGSKRDIMDSKIEEVQEKYYLDKSISKMEYQTKFQKFREMKNEIETEKDTVEDKLDSRSNFLTDWFGL